MSAIFIVRVSNGSVVETIKVSHDLLEGAIRVACEEFLSDVSPLESVRLTGEAIAPDRSVMEFEFLRKVESVMSLPNHNATAGEVAGG